MVGVDTYGDVHVACAIDQLGRRLAIAEVATTPSGSRALPEWAASLARWRCSGSTLRLQWCRPGALPRWSGRLSWSWPCALGERWAALDAERARLDAELDRLTAQAAPRLRQLCGVGPEVAGAPLVAGRGQPGRLHS
jgi:hypothetical protein